MLRTSWQLFCSPISRCVTNSAHALVGNELTNLFRRLRQVSRGVVRKKRKAPNLHSFLQELWTWQPSLRDSSLSLFSRGGGKAVRPVMALLMARMCNRHVAGKRGRGSDGGLVCSRDQCTVAMVSEMIHSASLIHDDVIDKAEVRRGSPALHTVIGEREVTIASILSLLHSPPPPFLSFLSFSLSLSPSLCFLNHPPGCVDRKLHPCQGLLCSLSDWQHTRGGAAVPRDRGPHHWWVEPGTVGAPLVGHGEMCAPFKTHSCHLCCC